MSNVYHAGDRVRITDGAGTGNPEAWEGLEFEVVNHDGYYVLLKDNGHRPDGATCDFAWPPDRLALVDDAHDLREQLNRANADLVHLRAKHEHFRNKVRDTTLEAKVVHSLCANGVNSFLSELELDPIEREFTVTVTAEVQVMASNSDNAATAAREQLPSEYSWSCLAHPTVLSDRF